MKRFFHQRGFTLIESLVALVLLTIALAPMFSASTGAVNAATTIKNNVIAANLVQEGIEVIRAIRDSNWFQDLSFNNGLAAGQYEVEWFTTLPLTAYQDRILYVGPFGRYKYTYTPDSTTSIFKRKITIANTSNPDEIIVTSEVTWSERSRNKSVKAETHLFNWK